MFSPCLITTVASEATIVVRPHRRQAQAPLLAVASRPCRSEGPTILIKLVIF